MSPSSRVALPDEVSGGGHAKRHLARGANPCRALVIRPADADLGRSADYAVRAFRSNGRMERDERNTRRLDRPRVLVGPPVRMRERVRESALPDREDGRSDLPVIGPDDSPRRVARRLV
jgi:hypothetical protein